MASWAQGLVKEVEGIRDFDPEKRAATRRAVQPRLLDLDSRPMRGRIDANPIEVSPEPSLAVMPLVAGRPEKAAPGYASIGFFPKGDIEAAVGYRLIDSDKLLLDAHGRMDRDYFRESLPGSDGKLRLTTTDASAGLDLAWMPVKDSWLESSASWFYSHFNYPLKDMSRSCQSVNGGSVTLGWEQRLNRFSYEAGASATYFRYGNAAYPAGYELEGGRGGALGEISGKAYASAAYRINRKVDISLRVDYEGADLNRQYKNMPGTKEIYPVHGISKGVLSFTPRVGFTGARMTGHLGFNLAVASGDVTGTNLGFNVGWMWRLGQYFALNLKSTSGPVVNTLGQLYGVDRYAVPLAGTGMSYIPADAELSLGLLSVKGFTLKAGCGFAAASDWVTPGLYDGVATLMVNDMTTLRGILSAGYRYGDKLTVEVDYMTASSSEYDRGYYRWTDRASRVLTAKVECRPIDALTLMLGYEYRSGRKMLTVNTVSDVDGMPLSIGHELVPIGDVSNLSAACRWQITGMVGVYGRVEGITQGRYLQANGMPGRRLKPMVGVTLNF